MTFFDIDPNTFPEDATFYFNVVVTLIYMTREDMNELINDSTIDVLWSIEHIMDPQPTAIAFVCLEPEEMEDFGSDLSYMIEVHPHSVVQTHPILGVGWYDMFDDFEDPDPWRL